jgi:hypothetical protein
MPTAAVPRPIAPVLIRHRTPPPRPNAHISALSDGAVGKAKLHDIPLQPAKMPGGIVQEKTTSRPEISGNDPARISQEILSESRTD